jgi:NhaP-type Na+/H+ or K+/H+ antiporter
VISAVSIAFLLKIVTNFGLAGGFQPTLTELLTFGALISATDPVSTLAVFQAKRVDPQLFMLVFGESVLNDAVGLVLFKAFGKFVSKDIQAGQVAAEMGKFFLDFTVDAICSPVLGLVCGCGAALVFKHVDLRKNRLLELSLYVLIMYVPFLLAQLIGLSGIVTILFTGMAARAYVVPNLSTATATNADLIFRLAAHLAESSIFLELGLCVFGLAGSLNILFILWALLACLIARALNIYPIAFLFNKRNREPLEECEHEQDHSRRSPLRKNETHIEMSEVLANADYQASADDQHGMIEIESQATDMSKNTVVTLTPQVRKDLKIHGNTTHMLWFSGLRGAVAYACVRSFPDTFGHQKEFVITTMVIVLVTVFVLGGTTEMVLNHLEIEVNVDEDGYMEDWHRQRSSHSLVLKFEAFLHKHAVRPNARVTANDKLTLDDDALQSDYQQHVEVTEFEHIDAVVDMGYRERESLFDYGAKCE